MFIADHHLFVQNGRNYVINVEKMVAVSIDEETAITLADVTAGSSRWLKPEIESELMDLGLIFEKEPEQKTEKVPESVPIVSIALFITNECNLNCIYCCGKGGGYGSSGHMNSATARKAIDWFVEKSGKLKKLNISFFGGEPLMNFPLVKEIVEYTQKLEKEFEFHMITNLSLLDDEKLVFIQKHNIILMVSFDGPKEIQDRQRPFKKGDGSSYDATIPKIKKLLSVLPETCCRATLLNDIDQTTVHEALSKIGFTDISITLASSSLFDKVIKKQARDLTRSKQMMEDAADCFLRDVKERKSGELRKEKNTTALYHLIEIFLGDQKRYFPCDAGRKSLAISNSGDIFLCDRFVGIEEFKLGSIHNSELKREPYLKPFAKAVEKCSRCFAKYICAGGCYHDNTGQTGSAFDPEEEFCRFMKRSMELVAYVVSNLNHNDKEYLHNEKIILKKLPTQKELDARMKEIEAEMKELGLTDEELREIGLLRSGCSVRKSD